MMKHYEMMYNTMWARQRLRSACASTQYDREACFLSEKNLRFLTICKMLRENWLDCSGMQADISACISEQSDLFPLEAVAECTCSKVNYFFSLQLVCLWEQKRNVPLLSWTMIALSARITKTPAFLTILIQKFEQVYKSIWLSCDMLKNILAAILIRLLSHDSEMP